jgi:hypothetical protein
MGEEAAALGKALARLKALNEGLEAIAKAFGAASFNAEGARTLITVAVQTKYDLLEELPPIHGVSFSDWYIDLARIDELLSTARHQAFVEPFDFQAEKDKLVEWIEGARINKERLERALPAAVVGEPHALGEVRKRLKRMNEVLRKTSRVTRTDSSTRSSSAA